MKTKNYGFRRTDVLFFGTMIGMALTILLVILFDLKWFENTIFDDTWISLFWIVGMFIVIFPVRMFPNMKYSKWWNKNAF
jgi:hypothetical protein